MYMLFRILSKVRWALIYLFLIHGSGSGKGDEIETVSTKVKSVLNTSSTIKAVLCYPHD